METPEFPIRFKQEILRVFFSKLDNLPHTWNLLQNYQRRGDTDCFYWMEPSLHPLDMSDLEEILQEGFGLDDKQKEKYLRKYKEFHDL